MLWEYRGHLVPTREPRTRLLEGGLGNRKLNKWQLTRGRNECNFKIEGERKEGGKKQREENKERGEEAEILQLWILLLLKPRVTYVMTPC